VSLRTLIISDRADFRQLLVHHLTLEWPDAMPAEYEPSTRGPLKAGFTGAVYDAVLLDHRVQEGRGAEWLEDLGERSGFPPIIYFAADNDATTTRAARNSGAAYVLAQPEFAHSQFAAVLRDAIARHQNVLTNASRAARAPVQSDRFGSVRIKGHRCIRRIALGGSSSVFLAENLRTGEEVALKVFRQVPDVVESSTTFDRFLREYELVAHLQHPNIARIYDIGVADDHLFLAMEYFAGGDLRARMNRPLPRRVSLAFLRQLAKALAALHEVGVLHRDVKPGNVLLRADDSMAFIDFGLARQLGLDSDISGSGAIFGTPHYMSPEQGHGLHLDARSDIYSLGVIFYEMLVAEKPYVAETPLAVIYKHANDPVPRLPSPLEDLQALVDSLLAKESSGRPDSVADLIAWIDEIQGAAAS